MFLSHTHTLSGHGALFLWEINYSGFKPAYPGCQKNLSSPPLGFTLHPPQNSVKACGDLTFNGPPGEILLVHRVRFDLFLVQVHVGSLLPPLVADNLGLHARLGGGGTLC